MLSVEFSGMHFAPPLGFHSVVSQIERTPRGMCRGAASVISIYRTALPIRHSEHVTNGMFPRTTNHQPTSLALFCPPRSNITSCKRDQPATTLAVCRKLCAQDRLWCCLFFDTAISTDSVPESPAGCTSSWWTPTPHTWLDEGSDIVGMRHLLPRYGCKAFHYGPGHSIAVGIFRYLISGRCDRETGSE